MGEKKKDPSSDAPSWDEDMANQVFQEGFEPTRENLRQAGAPAPIQADEPTQANVLSSDFSFEEFSKQVKAFLESMAPSSTSEDKKPQTAMIKSGKDNTGEIALDKAKVTVGKTEDGKPTIRVEGCDKNLESLLKIFKNMAEERQTAGKEKITFEIDEPSHLQPEQLNNLLNDIGYTTALRQSVEVRVRSAAQPIEAPASAIQVAPTPQTTLSNQEILEAASTSAQQNPVDTSNNAITQDQAATTVTELPQAPTSENQQPVARSDDGITQDQAATTVAELPQAPTSAHEDPVARNNGGVAPVPVATLEPGSEQPQGPAPVQVTGTEPKPATPQNSQKSRVTPNQQKAEKPSWTNRFLRQLKGLLPENETRKGKETSQDKSIEMPLRPGYANRGNQNTIDTSGKSVTVRENVNKHPRVTLSEIPHTPSKTPQ